MNEGKRMNVVKCVTVTLALRKRYRKDTEKDAYVRACLTSTFVKGLANGSLTAYEISAQYVQPFPRCEKWMRMCARAAVPHN